MILKLDQIQRQTNIPIKIDIETLVEQKMPPSPGGLMRLTELLRDYNTKKQQIVRAIRYEPVLVARILRLANSTIYSLEREVILVDEAINAIGNQAIYDIIIVEFAARTFRNRGSQGETEKRIWEHSLAVAILAREISQTLEMRGLEESFICGLLHDFGKFLLLNHDKEGYSELLDIDNEFEMLKAEVKQYGYNHSEVGSLVARRWNLPDEVCYSILNHHNPSQSENPRIVEHIIDIADTIANIKGYGLRAEETSKLQTSESVMKLGLNEKFLENVWERTKGNIAEIIKTFS